MINPNEFFRKLSQMMQEAPGCPEDVRTDFASLDKMDDIRFAITEASRIIATTHNTPIELKKEWLEYLTCVSAGIQSFLDAHEIKLPERGESEYG